MKISIIVYHIFEIAYWLIILRVFLSWIRTINWNAQPYAFLRVFSDTFLSPFQRLIPPVNGLDFSPIIAILALAFFKTAIVSGLIHLGL